MKFSAVSNENEEKENKQKNRKINQHQNAALNVTVTTIRRTNQGSNGKNIRDQKANNSEEDIDVEMHRER